MGNCQEPEVVLVFLEIGEGDEKEAGEEVCRSLGDAFPDLRMSSVHVSYDDHISNSDVLHRFVG